ncbi:MULTISPECIES: DNA-binding domain-containing protein [unclassified Cobetia]|uniref:HvfC/BufC N-terminal domain-containing protein n=1 Tax=unclassified Cobetia TaxID=2609414 RepID=UPI00178C8C22|nr:MULTISPECIES: DNA-binding domain-containing protein [unclassified Cobetia]MBE2168880.1 putative DNA-binding domain-containing protein [Cobetia sp. 2AS1]MDH2447552.1 DNA-binding domain-containing protein [Cobetia sp. 2AS]
MTQASPAGGADRSALMQLQETTGAYLATPSPDTRSAAAEAVISDQLASAEERLDIYAMAYRLRLFEVFGGDFEAVHTLIGDDAFGLLCRDYLAAHPPSHYSIRWAGQHFPAFVAAREPERSLVTEMAAFEWALGLALDVVDSTPLSVETLQTLAPEEWPELPLAAHPSLKRLSFHFDTPAIWKAIDNDEPPRAPVESDTPTPWIVWRQPTAGAPEVHYRSLEPLEDLALGAILAAGDEGLSFGRLGELLTPQVGAEQAPGVAINLLVQWLAAGLLIRP